MSEQKISPQSSATDDVVQRLRAENSALRVQLENATVALCNARQVGASMSILMAVFQATQP